MICYALKSSLFYLRDKNICFALFMFMDESSFGADVVFVLL